MAIVTSAHLKQLLLQLVDGQALALLEDAQLRLLPVRDGVAAESVALPLRHVDVGHDSNAPHVLGNLPALHWRGRWGGKRGSVLVSRWAIMIADPHPLSSPMTTITPPRPPSTYRTLTRMQGHWPRHLRGWHLCVCV